MFISPERNFKSLSLGRALLLPTPPPGGGGGGVACRALARGPGAGPLGAGGAHPGGLPSELLPSPRPCPCWCSGWQQVGSRPCRVSRAELGEFRVAGQPSSGEGGTSPAGTPPRPAGARCPGRRAGALGAPGTGLGESRLPGAAGLRGSLPEKPGGAGAPRLEGKVWLGRRRGWEFWGALRGGHRCELQLRKLGGRGGFAVSGPIVSVGLVCWGRE